MNKGKQNNRDKLRKVKKQKKVNYYLKIFKHNRLLLAVNILVTMIVAAAGSLLALLLKNIIDVTVSGDMKQFVRSLLFNVLYLTGFAIIYFVGAIINKRMIRNVILNMRQSIFKGIFRRNYSDFYEVNTADYISVLTNDIKLVDENYIQPLMGIIDNGLSFLFTLAILLFVSPMLTLLLFVGLVLMLLIPGMIGQKLQVKQEILSGGYSTFTSKLKDLFSGFEVIRSFHLFGHVSEQFDQENTSLSDKKYKADKLFVANEAASQFLAVFTQIFTIFAAAFLVIKGTITMGTLVAVMQLAGSFVMPLVYLMQNFPKLQSVAPIMKRMEQYEDYIDSSFCGREVPQFKDKITVSDLSFSYHEEQSVLENINLTIEKGKKYAIVGESGCGKSTLVKLLMGNYPGYTGDINYGGTSLKDCNIESLNELVSIIHQNVYMFDKSILDNICLFKSYPEEKINQAIRQSGVEKFLPVMTDNLNTLVGENGSNLSGGQRQRIAIARALVKGTPILILDEGTSAIDPQTSYDIEQSLLQNEDLTLITITHKMNENLLSSYDQIIYMDQGQIIEMGSYSELLSAKKGFYNFCVA